MTSPAPQPERRRYTTAELMQALEELRAANPNTDHPAYERPWTREDHDEARAEERAADRKAYGNP